MYAPAGERVTSVAPPTPRDLSELSTCSVECGCIGVSQSHVLARNTVQDCTVHPLCVVHCCKTCGAAATVFQHTSGTPGGTPLVYHHKIPPTQCPLRVGAGRPRWAHMISLEARHPIAPRSHAQYRRGGLRSRALYLDPAATAGDMDAEAMEAALLQKIKGMGNMTGSGSFTDDVQGFLHAIDWTEPFLKGERAPGRRHCTGYRTRTGTAAAARPARVVPPDCRRLPATPFRPFRVPHGGVGDCAPDATTE